MNTITSTQLTEGQQDVLRAYDKDIAHFGKERAFAEKLENFDDVYYYTLKIDRLKEERAMVLDKYLNG